MPHKKGSILLPLEKEEIIKDYRLAYQSRQEYDLVGGDGRLVRRVVLPAGRRLAGFGKGVLYLRETTADELQYLERYRL